MGKMHSLLLTKGKETGSIELLNRSLTSVTVNKLCLVANWQLCHAVTMLGASSNQQHDVRGSRQIYKEIDTHTDRKTNRHTVRHTVRQILT